MAPSHVMSPGTKPSTASAVISFLTSFARCPQAIPSTENKFKRLVPPVLGTDRMHSEGWRHKEAFD